MRAFILVALLAMAATVSCQDVVVSTGCNATSNALDVASVNDAEKALVKGSCTKLNLDPKGDQCSFDNTTSVYTCKCETTYTNAAAWETAVRNISNGQPCYIDLTIVLTGTLKVDNVTTKTVQLNATQKNFDTIAVGGNCTAADIGTVLQASTAAGTSQLDASLNANSASTGITWTSGIVTVGACGGSRTSPSVTIPPQSTGTTAPPSGTTQPPAGTTAPPTSTGKNGASVIVSSAALVASLCAAVILA